jgi:betaine lipid synthase
MDSMDWFDPEGPEAGVQITAINRALKLGGRVFLRSAGLKPWYVPTFERLGFAAKRVGARMPGMCIDRVNMYASTWIMTKTVDLASEPASSLGLEVLDI